MRVQLWRYGYRSRGGWLDAKLAPFPFASARYEIGGFRFHAGSLFVKTVAAWSTFIAARNVYKLAAVG